MMTYDPGLVDPGAWTEVTPPSSPPVTTTGALVISEARELPHGKIQAARKKHRNAVNNNMT